MYAWLCQKFEIGTKCQVYAHGADWHGMLQVAFRHRDKLIYVTPIIDANSGEAV